MLMHDKGRTARRLAISAKTAEELSRYMRIRASRRGSSSSALWLAAAPHNGPLKSDGVRLMLYRRGAEAGAPGVHPHRFRHTAYDALVDAGANPGTAMSHVGWSSRAMLDHYAASNAERRAMAEVKRLNPGDRI